MLKKIVQHLYNLYRQYSNQQDETLDPSQSASVNSPLLEKFLKQMQVACIKLSTLVSWANSLKNNARLGSIIRQGEQSTEINANVFIYKIYKYLMELCDAYNMLKDNEPQKKARRKAINNALNRLINLLCVMIGDPKGRTIYHKGKRLRSLKIDETIVSIIRVIIKLLNALKRKS